MKFGFVEGSDLGIDVALIDSVWKIHHRWLTFDGANYDTYCEEAAPTETGNEVFNCDHAILQLWGLVLSQIVATDGNHAIAKNKSRLKSLASVRLSQMPRNIVCAPTSRRGELLVTWESIEPRKNNSKPVKVTLHSPSCMGELPRSWDDPAHCRLILNYQGMLIMEPSSIISLISKKSKIVLVQHKPLTWAARRVLLSRSLIRT